MRFTLLTSVALAAMPLSARSLDPRDLSIAEAEKLFASLAGKATDTTFKLLHEAEAHSVGKRTSVNTCTLEKLSIRREFGSLSKAERKAYTDAVLCLQSKPARTPKSVSSGARSRFDDFVVTHILQTLNIHYSGTFLGWHRYFIWVYEKALQEECGFKGSLPYWEWSKWADAPQNSPMFNGDGYSMSGNGEFIPGHKGLTLIPAFPGLGTEPIEIDVGLGGGCVKSGPFKNMKVNLGPVGIQDVPVGPEGGLGYNPRCLKRDIRPKTAIKYTNWTAVANTLRQKTLEDFQYDIQGKPGTGTIGPHGGGHYTIGGDPADDVFVSPSEPAFYQHHAQIDRIFTLWQALDPAKRTYALSGTNTFLNIPPSANTTLSDTLSLGFAGGKNVTVKDVLSTLSGPFCYIYL